jgi:hypothetical protein
LKHSEDNGGGIHRQEGASISLLEESRVKRETRKKKKIEKENNVTDMTQHAFTES